MIGRESLSTAVGTIHSMYHSAFTGVPLTVALTAVLLDGLVTNCKIVPDKLHVKKESEYQVNVIPPFILLF